MELYDHFRETSGISNKKLKEIIDDIARNPNHTIFTAYYEGKLAGAYTVILEPKFIHNGSWVAHFEDLIVRPDLRGKGIATALMNEAIKFAKSNGCYKAIAASVDDAIEFHKVFGFYSCDNAVRLDLDPAPRPDQ